jgi:hypothetical protein
LPLTLLIMFSACGFAQSFGRHADSARWNLGATYPPSIENARVVILCGECQEVPLSACSSPGS